MSVERMKPEDYRVIAVDVGGDSWTVEMQMRLTVDGIVIEDMYRYRHTIDAERKAWEGSSWQC